MDNFNRFQNQFQSVFSAFKRQGSTAGWGNPSGSMGAGGAGFGAMKSSFGRIGRLVTFTGALILGGIGLSQCFYNVEGGHRAIKFNRFTGISEKGWDEGTHLMIPWVERPIIYNVRTRPQKITSLTGSRDLQMVNISLRVLHNPDRNQLPTIYRTLGMDYDEVVLPSIGNEILKSVVAQFNASELLTKRSIVSKEIKDRLTRRAKEFNIILDDVSITHLGFGKEYTAAVEAKQVAQQEAERAKYLVEKASQEAKSQIVKAEGEAEAARQIGEAVKQNPGFLELRRIEAALDIADVLSKSYNRVYINSESLLLDLFKSIGLESVGKQHHEQPQKQEQKQQ